VAPGTELREALESILRARQGALIVIAEAEAVDGVCDGGFRLDCPFTPTRVYELAKMDGAIVLTADLTAIRWANVQLQPAPGVETSETGARHRTAERVARQTGALVLAVSERRRTVTLYRGAWRHVLPDLDVALARANQALQVLAEHRRQFDRVLAGLTALELEDAATRSEVVMAVQRGLSVLRVADQVRAGLLELGTEGRLMAIELSDLGDGVEESLKLIARDHCAGDPDDLLAAELNPGAIADCLGWSDDLEAPAAPRGYRALHRVPRVPAAVIDNLVRHFGSLRAILAADDAALDAVEGVGAIRARLLREHLLHLRGTTGVLRRRAP